MVNQSASRLLPGGGPAPGAGARGRLMLWLMALAAGLAVAALTTLTAVRELETVALRREVGELAADLQRLRAQHRALQQKIDHRDIFKKIQMLENTIYADIDEESSTGSEAAVATAVRDSIERMDTLTEVGRGGDDVFADDEDDTSGDYYMDYGRRSAEEAKQNLVHLRSEDWIEEGVQPAPAPALRRSSRPAHERLVPGVGISTGGERARRSVAGASADLSTPRDLFKTNDQNMKKHVSKRAETGPEEVMRRAPPLTRTPRNTDQEGGRRPFVAAHFHGNTSHLTLGVDAHYHGNGLVRTAHEEAHGVWWPAAWTAAAPRPRPTLAGRGRVLVHRSGVYLVYVQVYYFDTHDTVGWALHRTNVEREGRDTLLQCTHAAPSVEHADKPNSCFSAAALLLRAGDRLAVRNSGGDRHAIMSAEKSFIGLVQLADADDPDDDAAEL